MFTLRALVSGARRPRQSARLLAIWPHSAGSSRGASVAEQIARASALAADAQSSGGQ